MVRGRSLEAYDACVIVYTYCTMIIVVIFAGGCDCKPALARFEDSVDNGLVNVPRRRGDKFADLRDTGGYVIHYYRIRYLEK